MSESLRLSSKLPGDPNINGLDALAPELAADPSRIIVALVWLDVAKIASYPETIPTVRVRKVEPLGTPADVPAAIVELAQHREAARTGRTPLPFEVIETKEPKKDLGRRPVDDGCDHVDVQVEGDTIDGVPEGMIRETCLRCGIVRHIPAEDDPESTGDAAEDEAGPDDARCSCGHAVTDHFPDGCDWCDCQLDADAAETTREA